MLLSSESFQTITTHTLISQAHLALLFYAATSTYVYGADANAQTLFASPVIDEKSALTIDDFISDLSLGGLSLSQDGSRVAYHAGPQYRTGPSPLSSIWIADTSLEESTRQVTFGSFHDHSPQFPGPNSDLLYFLSDRHAPGQANDIFRILVTGPLDESTNLLPVAVTSTQFDGDVLDFAASPDGQLLAFVSVEVDDSDQSGMPEVWNDKKGLGRLLLLNLTNPAVSPRTLVSLDENVASFSWSPDSSHIVYQTTQHPALEYHHLAGSVHIVSALDGSSKLLRDWPNPPQMPAIWTQNDTFLFHHGYVLDRHSSSGALWRLSASDDRFERLAFGESDDFVQMRTVGSTSQVAVEVAFGLNTRISIMDSSSGHEFIVFQTEEDAISSWDVKLTDSDVEEYAFVALRSSGIRGEPEEVWAGLTTGGKEGKLTARLSAHRQWVSEKQLPVMQPFNWTGVDGEILEGLALYPPTGPFSYLPTVIKPHGGPYSRDVPGLAFDYMAWHISLASQGCLVLMPNYRGSMGRGDAFAGNANGGMGTLDWVDTKAMLDEAILQGIADPSRLAIAGKSQGGFLTAWGVTRPDSPFKAGIMIDGVSDWGSLVLSSDLPDFEADLAGGAPWNESTTHFLSGSPVREAKNVKAHLLIIHGKEDKRTPLSQAVGFFRGILRESAYPERVEMVLYPNEGHTFQEKEHARDVMERVLAHFTKHLL